MASNTLHSVAAQAPAVRSFTTSRAAIGKHFKAQRLESGSAAIVALDPLISVDQFWMSAATFPPHPHAGFIAATVLLDDSPGGLRNRDSLGHAVDLQPGDLHLTHAGAGMLHEENPLRPGVEVHGLQMFINLPSALKQSAPHAVTVRRDQQPQWTFDGGEARLAIGEYEGYRTREAAAVAVSLIVVSLAPGGMFSLRLRDDQRALILRTDSAPLDRVSVAEVNVDVARPLTTDASASVVANARNAGRIHFAILIGTPQRESVVAHGPFVMNSYSEIADAIQRFQSGEMGRLNASDQSATQRKTA